MPEKYLDQVYGLTTPDETRELYDAWADSYDAEVAENGYATPGRVAGALAAHCPDLAAPILDFGCGTGLSGVALRGAGFQTIDGVDLSADMLKEAEAKVIYRTLTPVEAGVSLPARPGDYAAVAAIGVIGAGAAPAETFDRLLDLLTPGGRFGFSFNDHTLEEPEYQGRLQAALDAGRAQLLYQEHGPHLPKIDLGATVYVLEKR